jgi:hypothetical protein
VDATLQHTQIIPAQEAYNFLVPVPPKHWDLNMAIEIKQNGANDADLTLAAKTIQKVHDMTLKEATHGRYPLNASLHARFVSGCETSLMSPTYKEFMTGKLSMVD